MKTINLNLKFPENELKDQAGKKVEKKNIFQLVLTVSVNNKYQKGMQLEKQRMYSKVLDKLDEAKNELKDLSDEQFDFVFDTITTAELPPNFARVVCKIADELERVKLQK